MSGIKVPVGQKRLTNVAVVRLKAGGKRFEIACYKNKVINWREGIETNLNEVIQIETIFENVSKGIAAKEKDLQKAFNTKDMEEICKVILKKGELQVSDKEREVHLDGLFRDIVQIVVDRCIHSQTGRHHTAQAVENALKQIGFSVQHGDNQAAKKQALKAIESLCTELPEFFTRAKMRLRIVCPTQLREEVTQHLTDDATTRIEEESISEGTNNSYAVTFVCDPRRYRDLDKLATAHEGVTLQIVTASVVADAAALSVTGDAGAGYLTDQATVAPREAVCSAAPKASAQQSSGGYGVAVAAAANPPAAQVAKKSFKCSACGGAEFDDAGDYRSHCKSEWHNYNLKRKVKALAPVSEDDYKEIALDEREGFLGQG